MKIIDSTDRGFVVYMSREDLAVITGQKEITGMILPGTEISAHEIYRCINDVRADWRIVDAAKSLRRMADALEFKHESIKEATSALRRENS